MMLNGHCRNPLPLFLLSFLLSMLAALPLGAVTNTNTSILSNQTTFTGSTWQMPRRDGNYPEVKELFKTDYFKDVYEPDSESAFRRFEIVFVISLPALLLVDTLLIRTYNAFRYQDFNRDFDTTENWVLYGGSAGAAGIIAVKDYFDTKKWKKQRSVELELWRGKF